MSFPTSVSFLRFQLSVSQNPCPITMHFALGRAGESPAEEIHLNVDTQDSSLYSTAGSLSISALFWLLSDALRNAVVFPRVWDDYL